MVSLKNVTTVQLMVVGKAIITNAIILNFFCVRGQEELLPFKLSDSTYTKIIKANNNFSQGNYYESVNEYKNAETMLVLFPMERYKYSLSLWLIDDSINARTQFYFALRDGLKFPSISYFNQSPYIKELSSNDQVYQKALQTTNFDSLAIFKNERIKLIQMKIDDQKYRGNTIAEKGYLEAQDSINRQNLRQIISKIGWPGFNEVGYDGENSAFLIAQHSDNDLDFQKYCLQLVSIEFKTKNVTISNYAMLIDRYLINIGKKQLFGTQVYYNSETQKTIQKECQFPDQINNLRSLFQLNKLEDYLKIFN